MKIFILTVLLVFSINHIDAQINGSKSKRQQKAELKAWKTEQIKAFVRNKEFIFKANSVIPKNEGTKTLTTDFGIEIKNDSDYYALFCEHLPERLHKFYRQSDGFYATC